jgi:exodeoxyribonuclease-5
MNLTDEQQKARLTIFDAIRGGALQFVLFGYAGTGKTTLIKHLVDEARGYVAVLALTNKAVQVLRSKGIDNAETIHRFLYPTVGQGRCICRSEEEPFAVIEHHHKNCPAIKPVFSIHNLMGEAEADYAPPSLIIVDEASMVPQKLANDIFAKYPDVPVLAVGDPFQLPPVEGKPYWTSADFTLQSIQRQAWDNPIIRLAHDVRTGKGLKAGHYGETVITNQSLARVGPELDEWDQILVWRHVTRCAYNEMYRAAYDISGPIPNVGETIMIRSNHKEIGVYNGDIFEVEGVWPMGEAVDLKLKGIPQKVHVWRSGFGDATDWDKLQRTDFSIVRRHGRATYGYAITTHSAQGSEWDNVLIARDGNKSKNWMYTALTRARTRAMVCLGSD